MIETTYGRIMFNMILPKGMDFYNMPLRSQRPGDGDFRLLPACSAARPRSTCSTT